MGFWKIVGMGLGACGSIWAARCLGPEKLGISGMATSYGLQAGLLVNMGLGTLLIREFKQAPLGDIESRDKMISEIVSYRLLMALLLAVIAIVICVAIRLPVVWWLASIMVTLLGVLWAVTPDWLIQAQENQIVQQKISTMSGFLSALLLVLFIRPSSPAGSELIILNVTTLIGLIISWQVAVRGKHRVTISLTQAINGLPRLWRGRWLFLSALVTYIYVRFEVPMLGWLKSVDDVGKYKSALQILNGVEPLMVLVPALLYPRMIEWSKVGLSHLWKKQMEIFNLLAVIGTPCVIFAVWRIPVIYPHIYTASFQAAAIPCCFLILSKFLVLLNGIFGWGLWSVGRDRTMLLIMSITAIVSLGMNIMLIPKYGMLGASTVNAFSELLILAGCFYFQYRHCHPSQQNHSNN